MRDAEEHQRKVLHEAFRAGWQAALARNVTSPAALAVIESCFDLWLREEVGERRVLGLQFRRRYDLPKPNGRHTLLSNGSTSPQRSPSGQQGPPPRVPRQRGAGGRAQAPQEGKRRGRHVSM